MSRFKLHLSFAETCSLGSSASANIEKILLACSVLLTSRNYWDRMSFCVEYILIQRDCGAITKQQIEVFECFAQEKRLHLVSSPRGKHSDIIKRSVTSRIDLCVLLKCLKNLPPPFTIPKEESTKSTKLICKNP